jgi:hypothetical protein
VDESERDQLRRRIDEAKRDELEKDRHLRDGLRASSPGEIKRQIAERKAIFAAQLAHDTDLERLAIVARCDPDIYLVSVGAGSARILDLRRHSRSLSPPKEFYSLVADNADWLPFNDDPEAILAVAGRMIDAG